MTDCKNGTHSALKLSRIVANNQELEKLELELPVMIELTNLYFKKVGETLTVKFACGNRVLINWMLRLPF